MQFQRLTAALIVLFVSSACFAQGAPGPSIQGLIDHGIFRSAEIVDGVARAAVGPHYYDFEDAQSQHDFTARVFAYLQGLEPNTRQMILVETDGQQIATYSAAGLVPSGQ